MNRRSAIVSTVLSALGVKAAPTAADDTVWIDVITGHLVPGMEAPIEYRAVKFGPDEVRMIYVFPVQQSAPGIADGSFFPCIVGVDSRDLSIWTAAVSKNLHMTSEQLLGIDRATIDACN